MVTDFIGSGWSFPLEVNASGTFELASGTRGLEQSMRLILSTYPGERPMRPAFGCRLRDFVFRAATPDNAAELGREVKKSLVRWEPRVEVADVDVYPDGDEPGLLYVDIHYTVKAGNDERNLVFPFYTIPENEGD